MVVEACLLLSSSIWNACLARSSHTRQNVTKNDDTQNINTRRPNIALPIKFKNYTHSIPQSSSSPLLPIHPIQSHISFPPCLSPLYRCRRRGRFSLDSRGNPFFLILANTVKRGSDILRRRSRRVHRTSTEGGRRLGRGPVVCE